MTTSTHAEALLKAADLIDLAHEILIDLESLFSAIKAASPEHSHTKRLANLGQYVSGDWCNTIDCAREEMKDARALAQQAVSAPWAGHRPVESGREGSA